MASIDMRIPAREAMRGITMKVTVTGMRVLRLRWWLAFRLMRLSARIAGSGITLDVKHDEAPG